ncbi:MAG: GAF domain-containing protein [Endomicrobiales bacterium]|nr:GAF domain-containing protein [Endomicrobiales bacterium]
MSYYSIVALINGLAGVIVLIVLMLRDPASKVNRRFAVFCLNVAVWSFCYLFWQKSTDSRTAFLWCQILMASSAFIPSTFFHFNITLIGQPVKYSRLTKVFYAVSFLFFLSVFNQSFIADVRQRLYFMFWPSAGALFFPYMLFYAAVTIFTQVKMFLYYRTLTGLPRNQIKYLFMLSILFFLGWMSNYPLSYDIMVPPVGNLLVFVYILLVPYALENYKLLDIRIAVTRAGIFLVVYTLIMGLPFLIGFKTGGWIWSLLLMGVLASIGPLVYHLLKKKAENILLAQQRRYQQILLQASSGMLREHDLNKVLKLIVYIIKKAVDIEFAAIFLENREEEIYSLRASRGHIKFHEKFYFTHNHPLVLYMKKKRDPFAIEEISKSMEGFMDVDLGIRLVVPSLIEDRMLGFLALGGKHNKKPYSQDDLNVFVTLSNQSALAIENCMFMEEFRQAQEKIFNAEKLASIGGMADGVAHQIKNRLNQFSVVAGEQKYELQDFIEKNAALLESNRGLREIFDSLTVMSDSMIENVKKTTGIIQGILSFARMKEKEGFFGEIPIMDVVKPSIELLCIKHHIADFPIEMHCEDIQTVYGVKSQLMESMYNILDNGFEAVREKVNFYLKGKEKEEFKPLIRMRCTQKEDSYFIEISDNGIGIKDENKRKVFAPFFTTKSSYKSGTGIGMYVVKRMIEENHKGKIWYESEYMKGTRIYIQLPKAGKSLA